MEVIDLFPKPIMYVYTHIMGLGNRSITSIHSQYHHLIILYSVIVTLYGNYITPALW